MVATNKSTPKNPLEDKKWQKELAEALKRDIKQSQSPKRKITSSGWTSEIVCTQKDIGKPLVFKPKKKNKLQYFQLGNDKKSKK